MLNIKTFTPEGVSCFFKALGHPEILAQRAGLKDWIKSTKPILYDPESRMHEFLQLMELSINDFSEIYVQKIEDFNAHHGSVKNLQLMSYIKKQPCNILVLSFTSNKHVEQIAHLLPGGYNAKGLEELKLPDIMLTDKQNYLSSLNFATNFAWFKEEDGVHTRITTANYWVKYGTKYVAIHMYLIDAEGNIIGKTRKELGSSLHSIVIDSQDLKKELGFERCFGQLFIHFVGVAGHDVVKYALDIYGDSAEVLSATHDANSWPCKYFAGLPAPKKSEKAFLYLQNSHPITIDASYVSLSVVGDEKKVHLKNDILPFQTLCIDIAEYFPGITYPAQFIINAGNYFVRPRYEIINEHGRVCMAHVNVMRDNLQLDTNIKSAIPHIGKGYILPAPIMPLEKYNIDILPTPMSLVQQSIPLEAIVYDKDGNEMLRHKFGDLKRGEIPGIAINDMLRDFGYFQKNYGNIQLIYDFSAPGACIDGWLHGIFKYYNKGLSHQAETSFGSHIYNNITTYKNEPQSYKGPPPGLSTSIFLRISKDDTYCYLIYPVSVHWHEHSSTEIILYNENGEQVAAADVKIPANGCYLFDYRKTFGDITHKLHNPYVIIRDKTCRLFGYHMLENAKAFSLDHMFGF